MDLARVAGAAAVAAVLFVVSGVVFAGAFR